MLKKIALMIMLAVMAGFAAAQQAQAKSCGIELAVTDAGGAPVLSVPATIMNLATRKTSKASFFEGYPIFSNLREGKYQITVTAPGYKTSVKRITLNCRQADADQNTVSIGISIQKGSRKQIYRQADVRLKRAADLAIAKPAEFKEI